MEKQIVIFYEKSTNKLIAAVDINRACNAWKWIKAKGYNDTEVYTETTILNDY